MGTYIFRVAQRGRDAHPKYVVSRDGQSGSIVYSYMTELAKDLAIEVEQLKVDVPTCSVWILFEPRFAICCKGETVSYNYALTDEEQARFCMLFSQALSNDVV